VTRFSIVHSERVNGRAPRVRLNRFLNRSIRAPVAKSFLSHQEHRTHTCGRFGGEVQAHGVAVDGPEHDALSGPVGLTMTVTNSAPMRANWVLTRCTRGSVPLAVIAAARDRSGAAVARDEWQRAARATLLSKFPYRAVASSERRRCLVSLQMRDRSGCEESCLPFVTSTLPRIPWVVRRLGY
jgi:hypothetical protein